MPFPCSGRSRAAADDDGDLRLYLTVRTVEASNVPQLAMCRRIRWNAITVFREASVLKDFFEESIYRTSASFIRHSATSGYDCWIGSKIYHLHSLNLHRPSTSDLRM